MGSFQIIPLLLGSKHSVLPPTKLLSCLSPIIFPVSTEAASPGEAMILGSFSSLKHLPPSNRQVLYKVHQTSDLALNYPGGTLLLSSFYIQENQSHRGKVTCPSLGARLEIKSEFRVCALKHTTCSPFKDSSGQQPSQDCPLGASSGHSCQGPFSSRHKPWPLLSPS